MDSREFIPQGQYERRWAQLPEHLRDAVRTSVTVHHLWRAYCAGGIETAEETVKQITLALIQREADLQKALIEAAAWSIRPIVLKGVEVKQG